MTMKRRLPGILIAVIMTIAMLPAAAFAIPADDMPVAYDLYVQGVQVNSINKSNIPITSGEASYNPETNTLTLDNATIDVVRGDITAADTAPDKGDEKPECGIIVKEEEPFTINLIGKNTIVDTATEEGANTKIGICLLGAGKGTVTFTGGGSLDVRMTKGDGKLNKGINIQRNVDLDGVDVNIEMSGGAGGVNTKGVLVVDGNNTLFTVKNKSSLYITTDKGYAFDSNDHATGIHLKVEKDGVFEAVSHGGMVIHHGMKKYVQLTADTKALGALLNTDPTQEGAQEVETIPDNLGGKKYIRIPLTHDWGPWTVTKRATDKEDGEEMRACTRSGCTAKETRTIPKVVLAKPVIKTTANAPKKTMDITWKKVSGADGYLVTYRQVGGKWKTIKTIKLKYTVKKMKIGKYYEFKVAPTKKQTDRTAAVTGAYSDVDYRYFKAVRGTAAGVKKGVKLTWTKEKKAAGYIVYCSTSGSFNKYRSATIKGKNKTKYTFKGLKSGKTYYVIARSYIKKGGHEYRGITYTIRKAKAK